MNFGLRIAETGKGSAPRLFMTLYAFGATQTSADAGQREQEQKSGDEYPTSSFLSGIRFPQSEILYTIQPFPWYSMYEAVVCAISRPK